MDERLRRIIETANKLLREADNKEIDGAINWGDLHVAEAGVILYPTESGEFYIVVEEADLRRGNSTITSTGD